MEDLMKGWRFIMGLEVALQEKEFKLVNYRKL
jgi:hypothetical protein